MFRKKNIFGGEKSLAKNGVEPYFWVTPPTLSPLINRPRHFSVKIGWLFLCWCRGEEGNYSMQWAKPCGGVPSHCLPYYPPTLKLIPSLKLTHLPSQNSRPWINQGGGDVVSPSRVCHFYFSCKKHVFFVLKQTNIVFQEI